jgi:hypothetical protein
MNNKVLIHVSLIFVLHREERLTMLDGELSDHRARTKNIPVAPDVVVKDLGEYSPVLQAPVKHLVTALMRPCIFRFSTGFTSFLGHLILSACPR